MNGKIKASKALTQKLILGLGLGRAEAETFAVLDRRGQTTVAYSRLDEDRFNLLSDPCHYAILELIKTAGFRADQKWIAKRLNLTVEEVRQAVARLVRLGFLKKSEHGWELLSPNNAWSNLERTSVARRQLQKDLATRAVQAIERHDFAARESGSLTIACSPSLLPQVKQKMLEFRRELDHFIQTHENHDEVYQLVMSFFPLTELQGVDR